MPSYIHKIREVLQVFNKPIEPLTKNRIRFESIHADKRYSLLGEIYKRLLACDSSLVDSEVVEQYLKFSDGIQTNTYAAAELEWVTIATICYYRPQLTEFMIRRGLKGIIYLISNEVNTSIVFDFIQQRICANGTEPYGGLPHDVGVKWLAEILPLQVNIVQKALEEIIEQHKRELAEQ
jgi:hypothetical protein